jgi:hypothetical protein
MAKKKTSIKLVKKSDILLLKVWCSDEYFNDCNLAVLVVTDKVREKITEAKNIRKIVGNSDGLYKITYWNPFGELDFLEDAVDLGEKLYDEASGNDDEIQFLNSPIELSEKHDLRIDCELMHVYDRGIRFEGYVKNTNIKLETVEISFDIFELGRENKEATDKK